MTTSISKETIYDLTMQLSADGSILLSQGNDDDFGVVLHKTQVRYLAQRAGLIPAIDLQARIKELETALRMLEAAAKADCPPSLRAIIGSVMGSVGLECMGEQDLSKTVAIESKGPLT